MISAAGISDIGRARKANEDSHLVDDRKHLYVIADGMGRHSSGAVAARLTVSVINRFVGGIKDGKPGEWPFGEEAQLPFEGNVLRTALLKANWKVNLAAKREQRYAGMGSTVVAVWIRDSHAYWSSLGDSRLYLLRHEELVQLSEDDTLVQEQLRQGIISAEDVADHSLGHLVTRAVGIADRPEVKVHCERLQDNDLLMLCSDGLSRMLAYRNIQEQLLKGASPEELCRRLVSAANQAGGKDNVTVTVIRYHA